MTVKELLFELAAMPKDAKVVKYESADDGIEAVEIDRVYVTDSVIGPDVVVLE